MKTMKYLLMLLMMVALSVGMVGCGDDSEEVEEIIEESGVVGTWHENGEDYSVTFTFSKDGTGFMSTTEIASEGHSVATNFSFVYTYTAENSLLKLHVNGSNIVYNYTVDLTGNTLMLTQGDTTYVLKRG